MRRFRARDGREWEVTVGRESWGTLVLLFSIVGGTEVRKTVLAAETALAAHGELDALSDDALRERLEASSTWT